MTKQKCEKCDKTFETNRKFNGHLGWCGKSERLKPPRTHSCFNCHKIFVDRKRRKFCSLKCNASTNLNKRLDSILYGLTVRELEAYRDKQEVCEICGEKERTKAYNKKLAFDHDHVTGMFRGVLCFKCNTTFDYFVSHSEGFIKYAIKHAA